MAAYIVQGRKHSLSLAQAQNAEQTIYRAGSRPSKYAEQKNFIGQVRIDPAFQSTDPNLS